MRGFVRRDQLPKRRHDLGSRHFRRRYTDANDVWIVRTHDNNRPDAETHFDHSGQTVTGTPPPVDLDPLCEQRAGARFRQVRLDREPEPARDPWQPRRRTRPWTEEQVDVILTLFERLPHRFENLQKPPQEVVLVKDDGEKRQVSARRLDWGGDLVSNEKGRFVVEHWRRLRFTARAKTLDLHAKRNLVRPDAELSAIRQHVRLQWQHLLAAEERPELGTEIDQDSSGSGGTYLGVIA